MRGWPFLASTRGALMCSARTRAGAVDELRVPGSEATQGRLRRRATRTPWLSALCCRRTLALCVALALLWPVDAVNTTEEEKQVLLALRDELSPRENRNFAGWRDDRYHCWWDGVSCSLEGYVTHLDLFDWGILGTIPAHVTAFEKLEVLGLDYNNLAGTIPPELSKLNALHSIHLSHAHLTGTLPAELSALTSLSTLSLASNGLTGSIPPQYSTLLQLTLLSLEENSLTGSIPPQLSECYQLMDIYLQKNQLNGSIPKELSTLRDLFNLILNDNVLTGTIPMEFSTMMSLEELALQGNYLTGNLYRNVRDIGWREMELLQLQPQRDQAPASHQINQHVPTNDEAPSPHYTPSMSKLPDSLPLSMIPHGQPSPTDEDPQPADGGHNGASSCACRSWSHMGPIMLLAWASITLSLAHS